MPVRIVSDTHARADAEPWLSLMHEQVWKFPKSISARDLKACQAESKRAEALGLPGEVLPSEGAPAGASTAAPDQATSLMQPSSSRGLRQSIIVPGRESPRWLSLQQVCQCR